MQIGLAVLDMTGRIRLFNEAAEQILGYRAREVQGKPGGEVFAGPTDPPAGPGSGHPDGGPEMQLKMNARHKDGRVIPLIVTSYPAPEMNGGTSHAAGTSAERPAPPTPTAARRGRRTPAGAVHPDSGAILVFRDARQLERMHGQLQHLDRLRSLDEFAAGIVHEIRNPLASISINAQYIVEEIEKHCRKSCAETGLGPSPGDPRGQSPRAASRAGYGRAVGGRFFSKIGEEMQDILADVQSIESIVKRVLDFAHPNRPQVRACPIEDIVNEVLRFSKMPLRRQGIRLAVSLCDGLDTPSAHRRLVRVDVSQMKQVLFNVVRNACDAMPRGGRLSVTTRHVSTSGEPAGSRHNAASSGHSRGPDRGHVRVEVEDTGRGIAQGDLERIFDPFFSTHREGTGLGLAISRKIVESHGGRMEVESTPGKGTKFTVVLPVDGH